MGRGQSDGPAAPGLRKRASRRPPPAPDALSAPGKQELLIDGRLYDVTEFRRKHPGGSVLTYYLGTDATEPFREFHTRSSKADKYLKNLPNRPYTGTEKFDDPLVRDFVVLRNELAAEGYFDPAPLHVAYRVAEIVAMHALGFWLVAQGWLWTGLSVLGLVQGRCGWLMHEGGHYSLTGYIGLDRHLQMMLYGLGCGMSGSWWRKQHNKHHATPQKLGADVDLDTLPLVAFNKAVATMQPKFASPMWLRLQALLFAPVTCFLVAIGWQLYLHPRHIARTKNGVEAFWLLLRAGIVVWFGLQYGGMLALKAYCYYVWVGGAYIFLNFALSHTHLPVVPSDEHRDWVRYAAEHTMNVSPTPLCSWWMSFLNYQIEHHLFPSMPQFRHPKVSPRVRELFESHGLEYLQRGYFEAMAITFANLHQVGHDVFYG